MIKVIKLINLILFPMVIIHLLNHMNHHLHAHEVTDNQDVVQDGKACVHRNKETTQCNKEAVQNNQDLGKEKEEKITNESNEKNINESNSHQKDKENIEKNINAITNKYEIKNTKVIDVKIDYENLWRDVKCDVSFSIDHKASLLSYIIPISDDISIVLKKMKNLEIFRIKKKTINLVYLKKIIKTAELMIIEMFREIGFYDIEVKYNLIETSVNNYKLHFNIKKNQKYKINIIEVSDTLNNILVFDLKNLKKINLNANEKGIHLNSNKYAIFKKKLIQHKNYSASIKNIKSIVSLFLYQYKCDGYFDADFVKKDVKLNRADKNVSLSLKIQSGEKKYIGDIYINQKFHVKKNKNIDHGNETQYKLSDEKAHNKNFISNEFIFNRIFLKKGDIFNIEKIEESKINLLDTSIFSKVDIEIDDEKLKQNIRQPASFKQEKTENVKKTDNLYSDMYNDDVDNKKSYPLVINVNQEKKWMLECGLLYCIKNNNKSLYSRKKEKKTGVLNQLKNLYAKLGLTKFNAFGNGEKLSFSFNGNLNACREKHDYDALISLQTFDCFKTNCIMNYQIQHFREETNAFEKNAFKSFVNIELPLNRHFYLFSELAYETGELSNYITKSKKISTIIVPFMLTYKNLDSVFTPKDGILASVKFVNFFEKNVYFQLLKLDTVFYKSFNYNHIVFLKLIYSLLLNNKKEISYDKLLYTGGRNSVRAYGFQMATPTNSETYIPIGQKEVCEYTLEYTYKITSQFGIACFFDGAYNFDNKNSSKVEAYARLNQRQEVDQAKTHSSQHTLKKFYHGIGAGIRYETRLGQLKLDIATPFIKRKNIDSNVQVIISFGGNV